VVCVLAAAFYFLNRWAAKRVDEQNKILEQSRQTVSLYVIDKKMMKAADSNLPKAIREKLPVLYKLKKTPIVKAKYGPQIITLISDKKTFDALPVKKNVKVDVAGAYILSMKGSPPVKRAKSEKADGKPKTRLLGKK
jgi:hypothetical protein